MQRVAITGANGFTGRHLADLLLARGYEVHGLIHGEREPRPESWISHHCDLTDMASVTEALAAARPDKVVHLAAVSFVAHSNVEDIYRTNVVGTRNLLQAAAESGLPIDAVLLASSANIYGNRSSGVLTEESKLIPVNDYAASKIAMEYVAKIYADRLPIITARPFNYTGVGQSINFLIPKIVDHFSRRAPYIELGNLDVARDFSDVRAVVAAYAALLSEPAAIGETYNICSGRAYSLNEVIEMVGAISDYALEVRVNPAFVRDNEVKTLRGSRERLDALLPGLPNIPLYETLRWMLDA